VICADARTEERLGIRDAFRAPTILSMQISPNGKSIVAIAQDKGVAAVLMLDADTLVAKHVIAHGDRDARAPIEHSKKMVAALERNNKSY
jgi:hypothetical protein